ncbi:MAG: YceI family protein [Acidobacteriota bacterium]|nr:YceI family protein [Acidobacteriota bacterium]
MIRILSSKARPIATASRRLALIVALASTAIAQKPAAPLDINLSLSSTAIHWTLNTTVHTVHGTFKLKTGTLHIDPANGAASGQIVIDATSGESGDSARDKRMHEKVLESAKYPNITFRPTHVNGRVDLTSAGSITVDGIMNLHGQDHPMQITVNLRYKDASIASQSHFTIPFVEWGLKDPSFMMFRTEKVVTLDVDASVVPTSEPSTHASSIPPPVIRPSEAHSAP